MQAKVGVSIAKKGDLPTYRTLRHYCTPFLIVSSRVHDRGYNEEGKCNNAVARGKLGDLLSIEH